MSILIKKLVKLANHLDSLNMNKEADYIDNIIHKYSEKLIDQLGAKKEKTEVHEEPDSEPMQMDISRGHELDTEDDGDLEHNAWGD